MVKTKPDLVVRMVPPCKVDDCLNPKFARAMCIKHYRRWARRNTTKRLTEEDRFWAMVRRTSSCWFWLGQTNRYGAGLFNVSRETSGPTKILAHRFAWRLMMGPLPRAYQLLRKPICPNEGCVRPAHREVRPNRRSPGRGSRLAAPGQRSR